MTTLHDALRQAISTSAECDPREMDAAELAMLDQLDARAFEIMDRLIELGEGAAAARACIRRAQAPNRRS